MKANYWQKGNSIDFLNETANTIEHGTVVSLGSRVAVAGTDILPDKVGSLITEGVFEFVKSCETEIAIGTPVYFDGIGIVLEASNGEGEDATANVPAGWAIENVVASGTTVKVKIG